VGQGKLVRDRIPDIISVNGGTFQIRIAGRGELSMLLGEKLLEEVHEVIAARDESAAIEELADVLEVIHAYASCLGVEMLEIDKVREAKRAVRGGFGQGVVLIAASTS
jgi:predicted house-cleaning noncanonical NTP pyrophosphatase (MazG superfamily)